MNKPSTMIQQSKPIEPRPIRHGDPEYQDRMKDICLRLQQPPDRDYGYLRWSPTLPTIGEPHYALDYHSRGRLPCEHFQVRGSSDSVVSEFQNDARLTTSNLIDLQTKESWHDDRMRADVYGHSLIQYELANFSTLGLTKCYNPTSPSLFLTPPPVTTEQLRKLDEETQHGFPPSMAGHGPPECLTCSQCEICACNSKCYPSLGREDDAHPILCSRLFPYDCTSTDSNPVLRTSNTPDGNCGSFLGESTTLFCSSSSSSSSSSSLSSNPTMVNAQSTNTPSCGERVYKCDHPGCLKRFSRKEELTRHKRTHSNDRLFECKICKRRFIRKDHMTKHQATHEDVAKRRRYKCTEPGCERRYTRSDALSRHRSSAHAQLATHVPLNAQFRTAHRN